MERRHQGMEGGAAVSHLTEEASKRVWFINLPEEVEAVTPQDRIAELERENAALRAKIAQLEHFLSPKP